jgi:preprotein translocase subunit SecD
MRGNRLGLTLIRGFGHADAPRGRIALSLVHSRGRIDVPVSAIRRVEAHAEQTFFIQDTGQLVTYSRPYVEVYVSPAIRARMWWLTRQIIDQPLEVIVDGECVSPPIVSEALGAQPSFHISASDFAEAQTLAERLRVGWSKPGPRAVE